MKYYQNLKEHPKIKKVNKAHTTAKQKLSDLKAKQQALNSQIPVMQEDVKELRVSVELGDAGESELTEAETDLSEKEQQLSKIEDKVETQKEVVTRLKKHAELTYEKVYEEVNPQVIKDQKEIVKKLVTALESVKEANEELQEFQTKVHSNLKYTDLSIDFRRTSFYSKGSLLRDNASIKNTINNLKEAL